MFYIFFAFLFSFMLCASESVGDGYIEEIIQQKTLRVLYIDDSLVNLKMTRKAVETYNAQNAASQIELFTRSHGNNLKRSELETIDMVWCDIQMPGFTGDLVLANLREQHPDFEHPPFIAITTESNYHDSDEEISQHARDRHFIAGRDKIKTQNHIQVVLEVYYSWVKKQKEKRSDNGWALRDVENVVEDVDDGPHHRKACDIPEPKKEIDDEQTRRAWKISNAVNEDVYIEGLVEAYPPTMVPRAENTGGDSPEHSTKKVTPIRKAPGYRRKVFPYSDKADSSSKQNDGDDTESYLRKCMEMLGNGGSVRKTV